MICYTGRRVNIFKFSRAMEPFLYITTLLIQHAYASTYFIAKKKKKISVHTFLFICAYITMIFCYVFAMYLRDICNGKRCKESVNIEQINNLQSSFALSLCKLKFITVH